jgi:RNA polymerase sigma-70 factor, ECF subfamily
MQPITSNTMERMERRGFRLTSWWRKEQETPFWTAELLQERYLDRIFAYALRRVGNVAEAEDVAAEVFAAVFTRLSACPPPLSTTNSTDSSPQKEATEKEITEKDPTVAYLFGIAHRKIADVLRKRSRHKEAPLGEDEEHSFPLLGENPEVKLLTSEAHHVLWKIVYSLKEEYREVLLLKYVEEMSLKEIAQILEKTPTQVGSLLQQAREAAQKQGKEYFSPK